MSKWISELFDRIFAVVGAVAFSQIPHFIGQYQQHLNGRIAELQLQINLMQKAAAASGKSLQQYIQKFLGSSDPDFSAQGELINNMVHRFEMLSQAMSEMTNASVFKKPFVFLSHFNYEIARSTLDNFVFGLSLSVEGFIYGVLGIGFGLVIFFLVKKLFQNIFKSTKFTKESK